MKGKEKGTQLTCCRMSSEVSVLHSQDCLSWVSLFKSELNLTDSICFREYCVEELIIPLKPSAIQRLSRSRAVAVIISEGFLSFLEANPKTAKSLAGCIRPPSGVAILVGVTERDIRYFHKTLLVSYSTWLKFVINGKRSIPLQAVSAVRNMLGSSEGTVLHRRKETATKNIDSAPVPKKACDIRENETPFVEQSEGLVSIKEKKATARNIESLTQPEKMEDVGQKEVTITNTESEPLEIRSDALESEMPSQILMVPHKVDKDDNCVFLIFTNPLNNAEDVCVILERNIIKEPHIQKLNPYVLFFSVPEQFFRVKGHINVHIRHGNQLLDVKCLQIVTSSVELSHDLGIVELSHDLGIAAKLPLDPESFYENAKSPLSFDGEVAEGVCQDSEEDHTHDSNDYCKPLDGDDIPSFLELCTQLGLDEWPIDILMGRENRDNESTTGEEQLKKTSHEATGNVTFTDAPSRKDATHRASLQPPIAAPEIDTKDLRRSESLPRIYFTPSEQDDCSTAAEKWEEDIGYIDMTAIQKLHQKGRKPYPHEFLLEGLKNDDFFESRQNSTTSSTTSHVYVSMKLQEPVNEQMEDELSPSQQELLSLLQAFKKGIKTISEVEQQFQEWHQKYKDSTDDRDVVLRRNSRHRSQKERKRQSFGLTDIVRLIAGKPKKKTSKPKIRLDDSPKTRHRLDPKVKRKERSEKTGSKLSISSVSSATSVCSDGNLERKRDSGSYSDSNEESKNKAVHDDKSTNWFLNLTETCPLEDSGRPPTLPSRPPPVVNAPELPPRPPPKLPDQRIIPPTVPPKPTTLLKPNHPEKKTSTPKKKKSKADSGVTHTKKASRSVSPEYVTPKMHPPCPPKIREQIQQLLLIHQREARKNGEFMGVMKQPVEPQPRKTSAPDIRARSNSPRKNLGPDQTTCRIQPISPLVIQKEHLSRYTESKIPTARRSSSCPNFLELVCRAHKVHTYLELCSSDYVKKETESELASRKVTDSIPIEPPPLPPKP